MACCDETGDVAVIGMACRVAGANSPSELWDILANSRDVQSVITRFNTEGYYHTHGGPRKGSTNVRHAYMMDDEAIDKFDHAFFHITPVEAIAIDPQQRMLLEVVYESIENAGMELEDFMGTDTAVMAGAEGCDYHDVIARDIDATPKYLATGTPMCMAANRLSYVFNLSGPSVAMDTACSSTMVALHHAVRALRHGDSGMALVCGAKLIITPNMFVPSTELGFLSPNGRCRSFDAAANGYGRGEGVVSLLLKPLSTAIADGDPIRAVIKGTRLNQDGRTQGITLPSASAQRDNMEKLYSELGISSTDIQYLEAHGTGTAGGDKLEFAAINAVFGQTLRSRPLIVGAIKSCIGHLEACSGLAGVVKTVECLERGQIPPQMHFKTPNPDIDFQYVQIPLTMLEWPNADDQNRRAGINTFGAGGTNAHCVLESYSQRTVKTHCTRTTYLFMVSAADECSLRRLSLKYADYIDQTRPKLCDLAHTLLARRSKLSKSILFAAGTKKDVVCKLRSQTIQIHSPQNSSSKAVVFLFTGQGAQWPEMGKALIEQSQLFESVLRKCDEVLAQLPDGPSWLIIDEIRKCSIQSNVYESLYSQTLCTALQLGLVILLRSWGISPAAVLGHSSGEIAAAYTAGLVSFENAIIVAYYRGVFLDRITHNSKGSMCAVGMSQSDALRLLDQYQDKVQLAAVNSPNSCTLSGDIDAIAEIQQHCEQNAIFCRKLRVDTAYHSHHVVPVASAYENALNAAGICQEVQSHLCRMFSSVTGEELKSVENSPRYWKDNMISMVRFESALTECFRNQPDCFLILEIGPHPALRGPTEEISRDRGRVPFRYLHSLFRQKNDMEVLLESVGQMIACGTSLEKRNINAIEIVNDLQSAYEYATVLKDVPSYQWNHSTSLWYEARSSHKQRFRQFPRHEILGSRYLEDTSLNPSWRSILILGDVPWLQAIQVCQSALSGRLPLTRKQSNGAIHLPAVTFILMGAEAARQIFLSANLSCGFVEVFDILFYNSMPFSLFDTTPNIELHSIVQPKEQANHHTFEVSYLLPGHKENSTRLCRGSFRWTDTLNPQDGKKPISSPYDSWLLEQSQALGLGISPRVVNTKVHSRGSNGSYENIRDPFDHYCMDPEILHSIIQLASISTFQWAPPSAQRITSMRSFIFPLERLRASRGGCFTTNVEPAYWHSVRADVTVNFGEHLGLSITDIQLANEDYIQQKTTKRSLFFKPVILPDITRIHPTTKSVDLSECLKLVTHKWPMSDIAINGVNDEGTGSIIDALNSIGCGGRPRFRTVTVVDNARLDQTSSKIRFVDEINVDCRYHLIFLGTDPLKAAEACKTVLPEGLICLLTANEGSRHSLTKTFSKLCDISRPDERHSWTLWRRENHDPPKQRPTSHSLLNIFGSKDHIAPLGETYPRAECILLEPAAIKEFVESKKWSDGNCDAIIIDEVEKSIITTWSGKDLVPWFQVLLSAYKKILWVTSETRSCNPTHGVAANLLRSFQAEQPSLKVSWLSFEDTPTAETQERIIQAYQDLRTGQGDNEVVSKVKGSDVKILRYLPDDELSVSTGVRLPWNAITSNLHSKSYEVSFSNAAPTILAWSEHSGGRLNEGEARVDVEASVVNAGDVLVLEKISQTWGRPLHCRFFAGRVEDPGPGDFPQGSPVVGWYQGPHRSQVNILPAHLYSCDHYISPALTAVGFASLCIGLCIVDGRARARKGDLFNICMQSPVQQAVAKLCKDFGAEVLEEGSSEPPTFTIDLAMDKGFLVNDVPVDAAEYLTSRRGTDLLRRHWRNFVLDGPSPKILDLTELPESFAGLGRHDIYSTVLDHSHRSEAYGVTVKSRSGPLLTSEGTYVLIGGLGGLGRFLCSWMIENGARNLVVISRSGLKSHEARDTYSAINTFNGSLEVIEADASDRVAMQNALARIRKSAQIRGVLNLAMVLEDSDFASMTGDQWDRAVGLKRDSSWILHEETLNDNLDFFILFSSIASVLGNRGQGNYNIGNTFLNALAEYRRSMGLTAVSIALGAMTEIGVLHELGNEDLVETLYRSGLSALRKKELSKIIEAAVLESRCSDRSLILTGLEMFDRVDGNLVGSRDQTQLFWTDLPEFGFLQDHKLSGTEDKLVDMKRNLHDRALLLSDTEAQVLLQEAFINFLSQLLGFQVGNIEAASSLPEYGLDSLSALSSQYWLQRNLFVDIPVATIFSAPSIADLTRQAWIQMLGHSSNGNSA